MSEKLKDLLCSFLEKYMDSKAEQMESSEDFQYWDKPSVKDAVDKILNDSELLKVIKLYHRLCK